MFNRIRNIKRRWIIISATAAVLAIGLVSGVALAADARSELIGNGKYDGYGHERHGNGHSDALLLRVAEILGIEQDTLESAFATARTEQVDARFSSYTGVLVASSTLTQVQADEAANWFSERPAGKDPLTVDIARTARSEQSAMRLTRLVAAGKLTQDEAEAIASWHADRPDFLPVLSARDSDGRGEHRGRFGKQRGHH